MSGAPVSVVAAAAVLTPRAVLRPGWVEVTGTQITALGSGSPAREPDVSAEEATLVPGFVDVHVHGGGGFSFGGASADEAADAARWHRAQGSTTMLASLVSAPHHELVRQVGMLAELVDDGLLGGIHLEGPWLAPGQRGAHAPDALRDPHPEEIEELLRAGRGTVRMVTLAPERPGGLDAVRQLAAAGVKVAVGHTDADYEQTREAVEAGATVATHLFNAMPAVHHRRPGPVPALLEDERVTVEVVADGLHVHPAIVRWVLRTAGPARVALVTDAMSAAGVGDGRYRLGGLPVDVRRGVARLSDGTIAGSLATSAQLFATARKALGDDDEALRAASRICSATPAAALGLEGRGTLEAGRRADLVLVPHQGPVAVMSAGSWITRDGPGREQPAPRAASGDVSVESL